MMCGVVPMALGLGGHKGAALGAMAAGIPGALIGAGIDRKKKDRQKQRFGDGTTVDGAMS